MESVFSYSDYKSYIEDFLENQTALRGARSRACEAMEIHNAYLSQVIGGTKHLSLEQLERFASYVNLSEPELNYLLLLAQANRAGTKTLEAFFNKKLQEFRDLHLNIVDRIGHKKKVSEQDQITYYSSWHYAAIHTATLVESLRTVTALAKRFHLADTKVVEILSFLQAAGLVVRQGQRFTATEHWVRLPKSSPLITQHHANVRFKAAENIQARDQQALHYSGFFAFSEKDFLALQDLWLKNLKATQKIISPSKSERMYGICLDLFEV